MLRSTITVRRAAVALVAVLACVLAGCGGGGTGDGDLLETFAKAAETTSSADTVTTRMVVSFEDVPGAEGLEMVTEGESTVDGSLGRGTTSQLGEEIEYLVVDEAYYYAFPDLPDGKSWVRMTFDELEEMSGLDVGAAANQSPSETLSLLQASGDIEKIGDEDIDGVATTHYRAVVDIDRMNDQTGVASEDLAEQMKGLLGDTYEMDVWIDEDGYLRRMHYEVDLASSPDLPAGMPTEGRIIYEISLSDFGSPIDVSAPPADEVVGIDELN